MPCIGIHKTLVNLPGTIPSSTAACVAFKASVTLSFLSPTSASLAPPTCKKMNTYIGGCKMHISEEEFGKMNI